MHYHTLSPKLGIGHLSRDKRGRGMFYFVLVLGLISVLSFPILFLSSFLDSLRSSNGDIGTPTTGHYDLGNINFLELNEEIMPSGKKVVCGVACAALLAAQKVPGVSSFHGGHAVSVHSNKHNTKLSNNVKGAHDLSGGDSIIPQKTYLEDQEATHRDGNINRWHKLLPGKKDRSTSENENRFLPDPLPLEPENEENIQTWWSPYQLPPEDHFPSLKKIINFFLTGEFEEDDEISNDKSDQLSPLRVSQFPYEPMDLTAGMILDLILNHNSDGVVYTNLQSFLPELFTSPDQLSDFPSVQDRALAIQKRLSKLMEPYDIQVVTYGPVTRSTEMGEQSNLLHIDEVHPYGIDQTASSNPSRTMSEFLDCDSAKIIFDNPDLVPIGMFNLWYPLKNNSDYPLAIANAHNTDGTYGTKRFHLACAAGKLGGGVLNKKEFDENQRVWSAKEILYGGAYFWNSYLNAHVCVRTEDEEKGGPKNQHRISDDIRFIFYSTKGALPYWLDKQRDPCTTDQSRHLAYSFAGMNPLLRAMDTALRELLGICLKDRDMFI